MSTADSQLLAAASSISQDLIHDTFNVKLSAKKSMILARISVVIISIIAIFIASDPNSSVFRVVSFAWAGFGATFGPAMLLALFWKRANRQCILAGLVAGGVMIFVWKYLIAPMGGAFAIYELLPAFIINLIIAVVVSLMTKEPSQEIQDIFDEVHAK
jgi:sodium/proline symporter